MIAVVDIEADELLDKVSKIHCLCYHDLGSGESKSLTGYQEMRDFIMQKDLTIIGHNCVRYDIPVMNKILEIKVKATLVDTLPLSWTLYSQYLPTEHSLEDWGDRLGIKKPEIKDWKNLTVEEYVHRCSEDVKINTMLWERMERYLKNLYSTQEEIDRYTAYLSFKMDCIREQEEVGIKLDMVKCQTVLDKISAEKEAKVRELTEAMPDKAIVKKVTYLNAVEDANGNIIQKGDLFYDFLPEPKVPKTIVKEIIKGYEDPNPNSHDQIKDWLFSLGWVPTNIKHVKDKETGEVSKIPQIASKFVQGEVCESVKLLFEKEPKLELLNGLSIISHRIGIFEKFLKEQVDGRLYPTCVGLTNTLRLQHRIVVNLPGFDKKYGNDVRGCLIADEGKMLCGSDLSGIEDNTKRHYIYKYDPKYVEEMNVPGYDPHLEMGKLAGFITEEEEKFFKWYSQKK